MKTDAVSRMSTYSSELRPRSVATKMDGANSVSGSIPSPIGNSHGNPSLSVGAGGPHAGSFGETLKKMEVPAEVRKPQYDLRDSLNSIHGLQKSEVKFSNHAIDRMLSRGIQFTPDQINKLNEVVDKAASKGSRDSLVLMGDSALIVSVKNKTVVTVMDKANMKENVFTNIDSTIVM